MTPEQFMRIAEEQWGWISAFEDFGYGPITQPGDLLREARREAIIQKEYAEEYADEDEFFASECAASVVSLNFISDSLIKLGVVGHRDTNDSGYCDVCVVYIEGVEDEHGPWYCSEHSP